jgi:copper transport protein
VVGVLHFSAVAVWFGSLILLGTCVLPRPDVRLLQAVPRFSSVAFAAMVVIVVTGIAQSWRQLGSLQALGHTMYGRLLVGKVAVFLLLMGFAGYSRAVVRRKLTARAFVGAAASHQHGGASGPARLSDDADARSIWLLRRLVLAELAIALLVLAITALLGITTPPRATSVIHPARHLGIRAPAKLRFVPVVRCPSGRGPTPRDRVGPGRAQLLRTGGSDIPCRPRLCRAL